MKALVAQTLTGPSGLAYTDIDDAADPSGNAVVIDVGAAGVCFPDLLLIRGEYQLKLPPGFTPGMEVAGIVRSAPEGSGFVTGQRVSAFTMMGGYAERALIRALRQHLVHQSAGDVRQAEVAAAEAERLPGVIDAEQVGDERMGAERPRPHGDSTRCEMLPELFGCGAVLETELLDVLNTHDSLLRGQWAPTRHGLALGAHRHRTFCGPLVEIEDDAD